MTRARDVANVLTAANSLSTDAETAAAISSYSASLANNNTFSGIQTITSSSEWPIRSVFSNSNSTHRNHILMQRSNGGAAVTSGFNLGGIAISGHDGTNYGLGWNGGAEMTAYATQNWTSTNRGTALSFWNTPDNSTSITERMKIDSSGNIGIGVAVPAAKLDVSGNVLLSGQSTGDQYIRVGYGRSGSGYSYIDLQGDSTYINGLRIIRTNAGANAASNIEHRGTGTLQIITQEAGAISFTTNATGGGGERVNISSDGKVFMTSTHSVTGANWDAGMLQLTGTSASANNPGLSWHAPGASAMAIWHPRGGQALRLMGNTGGVENGAPSIRNITTSTSTASGGSDGDVWLTYTA
jgi:hypothetical protein